MVRAFAFVCLIGSAGSIGLIAACGSGGGFPDAKQKDSAPVEPGTIRVTWSLVDQNNATIDCSKASAISVSATLRSTQVAGGHPEAFACTAGSGESSGLPPGIWTIDWVLAGTTDIATAPRSENIEIKSGQATDVPPLKFVVDTNGNFKLHFNANKPGGNCGSTANNGAGITAMTFTLEHSGGGACETATVDIAAGATQPARQYTINCGSPVDAGCIEADQAITTTMKIPSGGYQVHIRGTAPGSCYKNDDLFSLPPSGLNNTVLDRTLNLGATAGGC